MTMTCDLPEATLLGLYSCSRTKLPQAEAPKGCGVEHCGPRLTPAWRHFATCGCRQQDEGPFWCPALFLRPVVMEMAFWTYPITLQLEQTFRVWHYGDETSTPGAQCSTSGYKTHTEVRRNRRRLLTYYQGQAATPLTVAGTSKDKSPLLTAKRTSRSFTKRGSC